MKRNEIMSTIKSLSYAQGYYGRLYRNIMEMEEDRRELLFRTLETQNFRDAVSLVLFLEG